MQFIVRNKRTEEFYVVSSLKLTKKIVKATTIYDIKTAISKYGYYENLDWEVYPVSKILKPHRKS